MVWSQWKRGRSDLLPRFLWIPVYFCFSFFLFSINYGLFVWISYEMNFISCYIVIPQFLISFSWDEWKMNKTILFRNNNMKYHILQLYTNNYLSVQKWLHHKAISLFCLIFKNWMSIIKENIITHELRIYVWIILLFIPFTFKYWIILYSKK